MKSNHDKLPRIRPRWREAAKSAKLAILGVRTVEMVGKTYYLSAEARDIKERADYRLLMEFSRQKQCVFDVGANVGATSLVMAESLDPKGIIYSFEASEATCVVQHENLVLNGVSNVEIVNACVSDDSGSPIEFYWEGISSRSSSKSPSKFGPSIRLIKAVVSIDDFAANRKCSPDFVKVDVEGAEASVIRGMVSTLKTHHPQVVVELHSWPECPLATNVGDILPIVESADYVMHDLVTLQPVETAKFFEGCPTPKDCVQAGGRVLLLPKGEKLPAWLHDFDTANL